MYALTLNKEVIFVSTKKAKTEAKRKQYKRAGIKVVGWFAPGAKVGQLLN